VSDWYRRGTDSREVGVCFYCGDEAQHYDTGSSVDVCDNPQCLDASLRSGDDSEDVVERFNKITEDNGVDDTFELTFEGEE
jgi:hypothetical protein